MSPGSAPWPSRVPRTAFSCCLQSIQKLWRTLCRNPGFLFMKKHVRPGAVPCVKRELNSLSSLILRCSLLLRLAGLCILHRGIDTVEVWGSSPHEPTTQLVSITCGRGIRLCALPLQPPQPAAFHRVYPSKRTRTHPAGLFERVGRNSIARRRSS